MRKLALALARVAGLVGSSGSFLGILALTVVWGATIGPFVDFSDGWLLVRSAVASIATARSFATSRRARCAAEANGWSGSTASTQSPERNPFAATLKESACAADNVS